MFGHKIDLRDRSSQEGDRTNGDFFCALIPQKLIIYTCIYKNLINFSQHNITSAIIMILLFAVKYIWMVNLTYFALVSYTVWVHIQTSKLKKKEENYLINYQ